MDSYEVTIFPAESVKNTHTIATLDRAHNSPGYFYNIIWKIHLLNNNSLFKGRQSIFYPAMLAMPRVPSTVEFGAKISMPNVLETGQMPRIYSTWFLDLVC